MQDSGCLPTGLPPLLVPCAFFLAIFAALKKTAALMNLPHLSEQEIIRRDKLKELQQLNIDPYPAPLYPVNTNTAYIKENYKDDSNKADFASVCIAGRIMSMRDMGKASFAVLQDSVGKIQIYVRRDDVSPGED